MEVARNGHLSAVSRGIQTDFQARLAPLTQFLSILPSLTLESHRRVPNCASPCPEHVFDVQILTHEPSHGVTMNDFDKALIQLALKQGLIDKAAAESIAESHTAGTTVSALLIEKGLLTRDQTQRLSRKIRATLPPEIPGFEFISPLGAGTTSVVWKAKQESLGKIISLKVFLNSDKESDFEDLIAEARNAARLNHPHIVHALDAGKTDEVCWFSMEYVEGETLQDKLKRRGQLSEREVGELALCITQALNHAHKAGLLHRDLKPANILIAEDGTPKVTDLGLALATDQAQNLEKQELLKGTPHYISPEQIKGESVDERSDLYALGATLYHCLTGKPPFEGDSNREILKKHVREEVIPIVTLSGKESNLDSLVEQLLNKAPADRPGSAEEVISLLNDLENSGASPRKGKKAAAKARRPQRDVHVPAGGNRQVGGASRADLRSRKTLLTKIGAGLGVLISVFMVISAASQASKGQPNFEDMIDDRLTEISKIKIERRKKADQEDFDRHESGARRVLTTIRAKDQDMQLRELKFAIKNYADTAAAKEMVAELDALESSQVAARQADGREMMMQATGMVESGKIWAAIEYLDDRPKSARQDEELNVEIERLLSVWSDQIDSQYEADSQKAEFHRNRREFDQALALVEKIRGYADPDLVAEAEKLEERVMAEKAEFVRVENEKRSSEELAGYKAIWAEYRNLSQNRDIKGMISAAVGLDSQMVLDETKSRINTDLEAFQILDGFFKMSLEVLQEKGDDGKEVTLVRIPLAGSTRERKDKGVVDRIDRENIWLRLSDQNAVMPFKITEVTDRFIFQQVADKYGKSSAEYRIPMGLLALYRGVPDVANEHFAVRQAKGAMPDSWLNLLKWYEENIGS